jgi:hypothetical protein
MNNPRGLKRWLNCFRYHYFMAEGPRSHINLERIAKSIVLELRWPDVPRSLEQIGAYTQPPLIHEKLIEKVLGLATESQDLKHWQESIIRDLGLSSYAWMQDRHHNEYLREQPRSVF